MKAVNTVSEPSSRACSKMLSTSPPKSPLPIREHNGRIRASDPPRSCSLRSKLNSDLSCGICHLLRHEFSHVLQVLFHGECCSFPRFQGGP
jgi:hypothetical protein